jgi:site-specific recombinase XerD
MIYFGKHDSHRVDGMPSRTMPISIAQDVFADLFPYRDAKSKYLRAPLLQERSEYISHLLNQGLPRQSVKSMASMQINAIKLLNMKQARPIHSREVQEASSRWATTDVKFHKYGRRPGKTSSYNFVYKVTKWLTFSGLLVKPEAPKLPLDSVVKSYLEELRVSGLSESTVSQRRYHLLKLQEWLSETHDNFTEVGLTDIDDYLDSRRAKGWGQGTLYAGSEVFRLFFRFCESQNWCRAGISRGILVPRVVKPQTTPRGPAWKDVRRMLNVVGTTPMELRSNAIISLCSIYALRCSEVLRLRLSDLDWYNEVMTVQRVKRGGVQRFPIQYEVGEAILAYLKSARPKSNCRNLFTTFRTPIRPMGKTCIGKTVAQRMRILGIKSQNFGPHALRHSCATQLLDKGFSLREIADHLGHRGLRSVSIYAKYNPRLLRSVASFSLAGIR